MDNQVKAIQWNCRSATSKKSDVIYIVNKFKPFVFALQETWLKPGSLFKVPGYACLREDRSDGYGGVALLIKHHHPFSLFSLPSHNNNFSIIAAIVDNICFVSVYIPRPSAVIFNEIVNIFSILPKPFIVLGDFNSQNEVWGSSSTNSFGSSLLDIVDNLNLCILNTGSPTRRTSPNQGASVPDLSLCTDKLASRLSWEVMLSTYGSDHFPIVLTFPYNQKSYIKRPPRLKYKLTDVNWYTFREHLDKTVSILPVIKCGNEQLCADALSEAIIRTADKIFPLKTSHNNNKIPSPPWWDKDCTNAIFKRKQSELDYYHNSTEENFNILCEVIAQTKKLFKKKKFESWRSFCLSISPNVQPSVVWRNIRRFRSAFSESSTPFLPSQLKHNFLDKLAPSFVPENNTTYSIPYSFSDSSCELNNQFTLEELKGVVCNLKDSAPGADGIPYSFLSNMSDLSLSYYLNLVNQIMLTGNIPISWKSQDILPILKPNKSPSDSSSYRPIALSSVMLKISEHLVKNRLEWFIESKNILSESQFGFRRGKSTLDSLGIFVTDIRLALSSNYSIVAAFLDITSAYDNVVISTLKYKLLQLKVPILLSKFILNILYERYIKLTLENSCETRIVWKGLPQGSVLSPLLYDIYTYDLESSLNNKVKVLQYADDLLLYYPHSSISTACNTLTLGLNLLKEWMDSNGLELSTAKSTIVLFSRMRLPPPVSVYYDNIPIPVKSSAKFLGVILDSKLTGIPHCEYIAARCEQRLNILRCLSGVWWGAHPFSLKLIYNAIVRSVLDYGTFLLEPGNSAAFKRLDAIQSKALRIVTGAMKSSPINALQVETVDPPLSLRRQYLSDRFLFRALQFTNHLLRVKLASLLDETNFSQYWSHKSLPCLVVSYKKFIALQAPTYQSINFPLYNNSYESLVFTPDVILNIGISKNDNFAKELFNVSKGLRWENWHHIYTDASKHSSAGNVGVGVFHSQYNIVQKVKLPPESSVFTGECYGLFKALEYINLLKLKKTVIFTDALSALQAIKRNPFRSKPVIPIILLIRSILYKLNFELGLQVELAWIPGHSNITGNIKADLLANEAVNCGDLFPYINYSHDLASLPKSYLWADWSRLWADSSITKGSYYARIQSCIPRKPWFSKFSLSKVATSCLIRMRLGHNCSQVHLARLQIVDSALCECGEVGDLNHMFFSCPLLNQDAFISSLLFYKVPFPTSISILLATNDPVIYKYLASFISFNNIRI